MASFAINHYFAGSMEDAAPFKLTNIAIHTMNGLLVFWLVLLILRRYSRLAQSGMATAACLTEGTRTLLAAAVALLWVVHPIQLTSVLYVVQRMTSLAAFFTLLALLAYMSGRLWQLSGRRSGIWIMLIGVPLFGTLGLFSKENTVLLPLYILTLEFFLFADELPWRLWWSASRKTRRLIVAGGLTLAAGFSFWILDYALPGYGGREFTLIERLLTEARVLFFYLSLILLPRIDAFGLYHDDIALSVGLWQPITTLPSLLGVAALVALALAVRRKAALVGLGIAWFFVGHLLESTVMPLEIAHEHRNYLPSLGILLALVALVQVLAGRLSNPRTWWVIPAFGLVLAGTTLLRASEWSDFHHIAHYEAHHHPNSPAAQSLLSTAAYREGNVTLAMQAITRATELAPEEPAHLINKQVLAYLYEDTLDPNDGERLLQSLSLYRLSPSTQIALDHIASCIQTSCAGLQPQMEAWLKAIIERPDQEASRSYYYYLLGKTLAGQGRFLEALNAFQRSHEKDRLFLHPLFEMGTIFVGLRQLDNAELVLDWIREKNRNNPHPRDKEMAQLAMAIEDAKKKIY